MVWCEGNVKNFVWRGKVAYMRVDVPIDVRGKGKFGNKKQIMKSLDTRDPRVAEKRLHAELALFHADCERVRVENSPEMQEAKATVAFLAHPRPGEELEAARLALRGTPEEIAAKATAHIEALEEELSEGLLAGITVSLVDVDGTQTAIELPPNIGLELRDRALELFKRDRASLEALNGEPKPSPQQDDENPSLQQLFERWQLERQPARVSIRFQP